MLDASASAKGGDAEAALAPGEVIKLVNTAVPR